MLGAKGIEPIKCQCPVGTGRPTAGRRALLDFIDSRTGHDQNSPWEIPPVSGRIPKGMWNETGLCVAVSALTKGEGLFFIMICWESKGRPDDTEKLEHDDLPSIQADFFSGE